MSKDRIYLYPGLGPGERHYLEQRGTVEDLARLHIELTEGQRVAFWSDDADDANQPDDLIFEGTVHFDRETSRWYAIIDWDSFRHASDIGEKNA